MSATYIRTGERFACFAFNDPGDYAAANQSARFEQRSIEDVAPSNFTGGPSRTRTCNQTVMSSATSIGRSGKGL